MKLKKLISNFEGMIFKYPFTELDFIIKFTKKELLRLSIHYKNNNEYLEALDYLITNYDNISNKYKNLLDIIK